MDTGHRTVRGEVPPAGCADALLGVTASFMWLRAEFQPRGDVIKGGVHVSAVETFPHIILLTDSAVANFPHFSKLGCAL